MNTVLRVTCTNAEFYLLTIYDWVHKVAARVDRYVYLQNTKQITEQTDFFMENATFILPRIPVIAGKAGNVPSNWR